MQVIVIGILCATLLYQPDSAEVLIDRANAEAGLVKTMDVYYTFEARHLIPWPKLPLGIPQKTEETEALNKIAKDVGSRLKTDPNLFLSEQDPVSKETGGEVHLVQRMGDFLMIIQRDERVTYPGLQFRPRQFAFGKLGEKTVRYRSKWQTDLSIPLPPTEQLAFATVNEALSFEQLEKEIQEEPTIWEIYDLCNTQAFSKKNLPPALAALNPQEAPAMRITHTIVYPDKETPSQAIVTSTVGDPKILNFHLARKLTFDLAKSPMPTQMEINRDGELRRRYRIEWKQFQGDTTPAVWFPIHVRREHYRSTKDGVNGKKLFHVNTLLVDSQKTRINQKVQDESLAFPLPTGTYVDDRKTGENYTITKQGKSEQALTDLLTQAPLPLRESRWGYYASIFLGVNGIVLLAILLVVWSRKRAKKAP